MLMSLAAYWQPYELLRAIQSYHNDSPKARAGVWVSRR